MQGHPQIRQRPWCFQVYCCGWRRACVFGPCVRHSLGPCRQTALHTISGSTRYFLCFRLLNSNNCSVVLDGFCYRTPAMPILPTRLSTKVKATTSLSPGVQGCQTYPRGVVSEQIIRSMRQYRLLQLVDDFVSDTFVYVQRDVAKHYVLLFNYAYIHIDIFAFFCKQVTTFFTTMLT